MRFHQITSLLFLGIAAVSYCHQVENGLEARTVPKCKKATMFHRVSRPKASKKPVRSVKSIGGKCKRKRSEIFKADDISTINKRTGVVTFEMNGQAAFVTVTKAGDSLHTHSLGGCSVVAIFTKTFAVSVHVSQGTDGKKDQASTAKVAMAKLLNLYQSKGDLKQAIKVLVFTADLGVDTIAADTFLGELEEAKMGKEVVWHMYDSEQFCALDNPLTQSTLYIT